MTSVEIILVYFGIGAIVSGFHIRNFLSGRFDKVLAEELSQAEIEQLRTPSSVLISWAFGLTIWPRTAWKYLLVTINGVFRIPSFGSIRTDGNTYLLAAWWPYKLGLMFINKPPPDVIFMSGTSPEAPGRVSLAIVRADNYKCIWHSNMSLANAKHFTKGMELVIGQVEFFNHRGEKNGEQASLRHERVDEATNGEAEGKSEADKAGMA